MLQRFNTDIPGYKDAQLFLCVLHVCAKEDLTA